MKLPGGDRAIIDTQKLREYLLSPEHPIGRFKASFFRRLGFTNENLADFETALKKAAVHCDPEKSELTEYGQKYVMQHELIGPTGRSADVVSVWIVKEGEDAPRLVTVYPV